MAKLLRGVVSSKGATLVRPMTLRKRYLGARLRMYNGVDTRLSFTRVER